MSVYSSETDPTVVTDAVYLSFIDRHSKQLVVAKHALLQVFQLVKKEVDLDASVGELSADGHVEAAAEADAKAGIVSSQKGLVTRLVLVAELRLSGIITGLGTIRSKEFPETGLELLLVSFTVAKCSLLGWNAAEQAIQTLSIHTFERDEFISPLYNPISGNLRLDPASRVATLSFYGQRLAFLPIAQVDELMAEEDQDTNAGVISKSFVLSMGQLEDDIAQLIDFAYLDGYREPTLAILFTAESTAPALKDWRKDTTHLIVLTLDLQAGARTAIYEIEKLPEGLHTVFPIPEPVGGCLLIGNNELIYVDPAARTVALAVNTFSKLASDYTMRDYSHLALKLEGARCVALKTEQTIDGILLSLADATLALLTLNMDGRTVSSLHLKVVGPEFGGNSIQAAPSCAVLLDDQRVFIGSTLGNSSLVAWHKTARKAAPSEVAPEQTQEADDDDLGDLYGEDSTTKQILGSETTTFDVRFTLNDTLFNAGPMVSVTPGATIKSDANESLGTPTELAVVSGHGSSGNLSILRKSIHPQIVGKFDSPAWQAMWTLKTRSKRSDATKVQHGLDTYLVASRKDETQIFTIDTAFVEKTDSEFETSDGTIAAGTVDGDTCVVQICADMMRTYDAELRLLQLIPTPEECLIISASIVDPYVLLLLSNGKLVIYTIDANRDLVELEQSIGEGLASAILFQPSSPSPLDAWLTVPKKRKRAQEDGKPCLCFAISKDGSLTVHLVPSMRQVFSQQNADLLPALLTGRNASLEFKPASTPLVELLVANLGQSVLSPHLILRSSLGDLTTYKFGATEHGVVLSKLESLQLTRHGETQEPVLLTRCLVGGYACVFVKGGHPYWLIQSDQSLPTLYPASTGSVRSFSGFNTLDAPAGYIYCDEQDTIRICQLPDKFLYTQRWSSHQVKLGCSVDGVAYMPEQEYFALATSRPVAYEVRDEDDEVLPPPQENKALLPLIDRGSLEIINKSQRMLDRFDFAENEQVLCLKYAPIKVHTDLSSAERPCLAVATGIFRGEDLTMRGAIYLFEVVRVESDEPEPQFRLRIVVRDEIKAAATTLCVVDGYLVIAQGHKVLVRSLEEDERLVPVAFVDLGLYTTTAKALRNTLLLGDIQQGLRFVGFQEEPYRLVVFGRDYQPLDVVDADFMIRGKTLFFVASDPEGNLFVLQYDPDNPASIAGTHLVRKGDIHTGKQITCMTTAAMKPVVDPTAESEAKVDSTAVLCGGRDGSLSVMMPVSERVFRRLYTIQTHFAGSLLLPASLNQRAFRHSVAAETTTTNPLRGILDGDFVRRFAGLDVVARAEVAKKCAIGVDGVVTELQDLHRATSMF